MAPVTMKDDALPQIHLVRDTDLGVFAYELHILAGDFLRESEFNLRSLATNTRPDSIAIMGKNHIWLADALSAYYPTGELYRMAAMTEYPGARAFLFHTERKEDGRLYGDVLMTDLDTLRQDIERNTLYPYGAQNPDTDMYRIPLGTAKQLLLDGASVYRLLPGGAEKIAPIAAVRAGLWYEHYREFAVTPEDLGALDRLVRRETDRLMRIRPQLDKSQERRPSPER